MAISQVEICRDVLETAYRVKLGTSFSSSIAEIGQGRQPVWRSVSASDLISKREPHSAGAAGLLLDPEIGLLLYILPFSARTNVHQQIVKALSLRSQLAVEKNYPNPSLDKPDPRGSWRVVVHWLVPTGETEQWTNQVEKVRRDTAFSEELSLDAIFVNDGDVKSQIERFGFPRLLITTREVFKKQRLQDVTGWLSADQLVRAQLADFDSYFHHSEQREYASEIKAELERFDISKPTISSNPVARKIRKIHIRNFRNLRDVRFDFGVPSVSASVVHGPNGTGKSSLCEAISIGLFNSSFRYDRFSDNKSEKDVTSHDRAREYLTKYLAPLDDPQLVPTIGIDDQTPAQPHLQSGDYESELTMAGTILTQDTSVEFARMPAHELGALVLRGYSGLAEHLDNFTDSRVNQVNEARQRFLRSLGLSAAITKISTAYEKIAKRELDQSLPGFPTRLVVWLEEVNKIGDDFRSDLAGRWRAWGDDDARVKLAARISSLSDRPTQITREIRDWLQSFDELATASEELLLRLEANPILKEGSSDLIKNLIALGEWAEAKSQDSKSISPQASSNQEELIRLQTDQQQIIVKGQDAKLHLDHLAAVEGFVRDIWSKRHSNTCPTCNEDHSDHGGILSVVENLHADVAKERETLRTEFQNLQNRIASIKKELISAGDRTSPLTPEQESEVTQAFQFLMPARTNLVQWISVKAQRDAVIDSINILRQRPIVPTRVSVEIESDRVTNKIISQFMEADRTFEAPDNWKPVKAKLTETLADIVRNHLPNTLAKLWCELTINLTSAPWLLPDRPCLGISTRRGEQRSTVIIKDRLARYILNQSEIHTLGLAWFFTSYLTRGRFFNACLIMDDPAQELDQTSYRDLCRLWETLVRLHKVYKRSLKLVIMLNQENRAVEAARATGGTLYVLGWARDHEGRFRKIDVIGSGFFCTGANHLVRKDRLEH